MRRISVSMLASVLMINASQAAVIDFESISPGPIASSFLSSYGITSVVINDGEPLYVFQEQSGASSSSHQNPGGGNFFGQSNGPAAFSSRILTFDFAPGLTAFGFTRIGGTNLTTGPGWTATALDSQTQQLTVPFSENSSASSFLGGPASFLYEAPSGKTISSFSFHVLAQGSTFGTVPLDNLVLTFAVPEPVNAGLLCILAGVSLTCRKLAMSDR